MKLTDNLYLYPEKGIFDCNTYVINDNLTVVIDSGSTQFLPALIEDLVKDGIDPKDIDIITNTHLHPDHCSANIALKEISGGEILFHPLHKKFYDAALKDVPKLLGLPSIELKEDGYLDNNKLNSGEMEFELIHSPGHSPDSICFYCRKVGILICGDVIFNQNTGRVDLPGGNGEQLKHSIEELSQLIIEYLLPGHMDIITGTEKVKNNFEFVKQNILRWL
ncbi:MAG TPA: MBL fold metallo-hydrolase [Dehalococcoidia bacterium]|nr:MBL fold metallo-hydrolase [Dehalococcoidia bacterium]